MPKSKSKSKKRKTSQHNYNANATDELSHAEIWDDSALLRSWDEALGEYEYYHSIHARGEDVDEVLRKAELDEEKERRAVTGAKVPGRAITENDAHAGSNAGSEDGEVESDDGDGRSTNVLRENADVLRSTEREENMKPRMRIPSHLDDDEEGEDEEDSGTAAQRLGPGAHGAHHGPYLPGARSSATEDRSRLPSIFVDDEDDVPALAVGSSKGRGQDSKLTALPVPVDQTLENIKMAYYWAGYYSGLYDGQKQARSQAQASGTGNVPGHGSAR